MVKTRQRSKRWKPQIAAYQVNTYINTAAVPENTIQHKNEGYQIWRDIFKAHSWRSWGVNSMFADYIISLMIFTPPPRLFLTCPSNLQRPTNQPKTVFNGMLVASKKGPPCASSHWLVPYPRGPLNHNLLFQSLTSLVCRGHWDCPAFGGSQPFAPLNFCLANRHSCWFLPAASACTTYCGSTIMNHPQFVVYHCVQAPAWEGWFNILLKSLMLGDGLWFCDSHDPVVVG